MNQLLDYLGKLTANYINEKGYQAYHIPSTVSTRDQVLLNLSTPLPHKTVATRAGIGWIGKSALLITGKYGSAIRLTTVLTNMEFLVGIPVNISYCGECNECVLACPAQAISGENWYRGIEREKIYNAFKCRESIRQIISKVKITDIICGRCIVACPWTKKYINLYTN